MLSHIVIAILSVDFYAKRRSAKCRGDFTTVKNCSTGPKRQASHDGAMFGHSPSMSKIVIPYMCKHSGVICGPNLQCIKI